jgi:hypothetical protein
MTRCADLMRFYGLLGRLSDIVGGARTPSSLRNYSDWPRLGVYFFFEPGEVRQDSGEGPRVVRIGTHALASGSKSTLLQRLRQHRGQASGSGNHRGSIFRLLVGQALLAKGHSNSCPSWGQKSSASSASAALEIDRATMAAAEESVEQAVSRHISAMQFVWLAVDDEPGPTSLRGTVERNAIALLSNYGRTPLDPASAHWLGHASDRPLVRSAGLWNQRHVAERHDPRFLHVLEDLVERMASHNSLLSEGRLRQVSVDPPV